MGWIYSHKRKRHQRAINKVVRNCNRAIENDELWRGRFVVRQKHSQFYHYEDKSGAYMWVSLEFRDKKFGTTKMYNFDTGDLCMWNGSKLFWAMNDFIIKHCHAWEEDDPYKDTTDYRLFS